MFPKIRVPTQDGFGCYNINMPDLFRMITEDFEKQNKKFQEMDCHFEDFKAEMESRNRLQL